jgi:hypothetical protein
VARRLLSERSCCVAWRLLPETRRRRFFLGVVAALLACGVHLPPMLHRPAPSACSVGLLRRPDLIHRHALTALVVDDGLTKWIGTIWVHDGPVAWHVPLRTTPTDAPKAAH